MKKILIILAAFIGFGLSALAQSNLGTTSSADFITENATSNDVTMSNPENDEIALKEKNDVSDKENDLAYNNPSNLESGCRWEVWDDYNSYCRGYKIYYTNTCNVKCKVHVEYKIVPHEGYSGKTEYYKKDMWLSANRSNATLVDCYTSSSAILTSNPYVIEWEDD